MLPFSLGAPGRCRLIYNVVGRKTQGEGTGVIPEGSIEKIVATA